MAKRRKLEAPSAEDLGRLEKELDNKVIGLGGNPARGAGLAPIAQVAAETASGFDPRSVETRAEAVRDKTDAAALRDARGRGLVMLELSVDLIDADALVRDRVVLDAEEMEELKSSIAKSGLRLPIEVFEYATGAQGSGGQGAAVPSGNGDAVRASGRYGLLSGYRRLMAVRQLRALSGDPAYDTIKAVVRDPDTMGGPFAAMVEENEIRASLSHFERGRIAVIAAVQGAFVNTEAAVNALFPMASKAKRSKIRSFALIYEELGDMLVFPDLIKEKDGLKIAAILRDGGEARLREALERQQPGTPQEEEAILVDAVSRIAAPAPDRTRGGRPRKGAQAVGSEVRLQSGVTLQLAEDGKGWMIRMGGDRVDRALAQDVLDEVRRLLDR